MWLTLLLYEKDLVQTDELGSGRVQSKYLQFCQQLCWFRDIIEEESVALIIHGILCNPYFKLYNVLQFRRQILFTDP
jgi:hypothetical protein